MLMSVQFQATPSFTAKIQDGEIQKPKAVKSPSSKLSKTAASTANAAADVDRSLNLHRSDRSHLADWQWENVKNLQAAQNGSTEHVVSPEPASDGECVVQ